jgi:hypothetical protein
MSGTRPWRQQQKPRITPDDVKFADFTGVVNTRSRKDIGLKALYAGDNVFISDTKKVTRRDGYTPYLTTGTVQAAYGGAGPLYVVDAGVLQRVASPTDKHTLISGLTGKNYSWDVTNNDAYFVNGVDAGIARGDQFLPWRLTSPTLSGVTAVSAASLSTVLNVGETYVAATFRVCATYETADGRESAPSEIFILSAAPLTNLIRVVAPTAYARINVYATEADGTVFRLVATSSSTAPTVSLTFNPARGGRELTTLATQSLPDGVELIAFMKGNIYASQYFTDSDTSVVWFSKAFAYHLFDCSEDYIVVPGRVSMLLWISKDTTYGIKDWLLIGSTKGVWQRGDEDKFENLANYGVVPGIAGDVDPEGTAWFWTQRGICTAPPFKNLTEEDVSMAPGVRANATLVYHNGTKQLLTVTQGGGTAFNSRRERT